MWRWLVLLRVDIRLRCVVCRVGCWYCARIGSLGAFLGRGGCGSPRLGFGYLVAWLGVVLCFGVLFCVLSLVALGLEYPIVEVKL